MHLLALWIQKILNSWTKYSATVLPLWLFFTEGQEIVGWQKISITTVMNAVQQYRCSKLKPVIVLVASLTLSGHHLEKMGMWAMIVQCSLIWPLIHLSLAKIQLGLSGAAEIVDHTLEEMNYQYIMNHLIKRTHASHLQIIVVSVSLRIVRE